MDTFTILDIAEDRGEVTVQFSFLENKTILGGLPLNDKEALINAINEHGQGLKKELEAKQVDPGIKSLIDQPQELKAAIVEPAPVEPAPTAEIASTEETPV